MDECATPWMVRVPGTYDPSPRHMRLPDAPGSGPLPPDESGQVTPRRRPGKGHLGRPAGCVPDLEHLQQGPTRRRRTLDDHHDTPVREVRRRTHQAEPASSRSDICTEANTLNRSRHPCRQAGMRSGSGGRIMIILTGRPGGNVAHGHGRVPVHCGHHTFPPHPAVPDAHTPRPARRDDDGWHRRSPGCTPPRRLRPELPSGRRRPARTSRQHRGSARGDPRTGTGRPGHCHPTGLCPAANVRSYSDRGSKHSRRQGLSHSSR